MGKTRLVRELWEVLGPGGAVEIFDAPADARPTAMPSRIARSGTCSRSTSAFWTPTRPNACSDGSASAAILALALGLDVAGDLHPRVARDRLHDAWLSFVAELAAQRPLVLLLEDLHWAESPCSSCSSDVAREVRAPVLAVGTGRSRTPRPRSGPRPASRFDSSRCARGVEDWLGKLFPARSLPTCMGCSRRGGKPPLPRGTRRCPDGAGCTYVGRTARPRASSPRRRRPRVGPGGSRRPHRPASSAREVGAPGRIRHRPDVLAWLLCASWWTAATPTWACSSNATSSDGSRAHHWRARASSSSSTRSLERSHTPRSRGGSVRACTRPSPHGWSGSSAARDEHAALLLITMPRLYAPKTPTLPGAPSPMHTSMRGAGPSGGFGGRPSLLQPATRSPMRSRCSSAPSLSWMTDRSGSSSCTYRAEVQIAGFDVEGFRESMEEALDARPRPGCRGRISTRGLPITAWAGRTCGRQLPPA